MKLSCHRARVFVLVLLAGAVGIISREAPPDFFKLSSIAAQTSLTDVRSNQRGQNPDAAARARISQSYGKLPMLFEADRDHGVKFIARGGGYALFLTDNQAVLRLRKAERGNEGVGSGEWGVGVLSRRFCG